MQRSPELVIDDVCLVAGWRDATSNLANRPQALAPRLPCILQPHMRSAWLFSLHVCGSQLVLTRSCLSLLLQTPSATTC
jgi:hypothetical protein